MPGNSVNLRSIDNLLAAMMEMEPPVQNSDLNSIGKDNLSDALDLYKKIVEERNKIVAAQVAASQRVSSHEIINT